MKQITRISPFQTAKVISVIYFVLSLVVLIPLGLFNIYMYGAQTKFLAMGLILPIVYLIGGFLGTAAFAGLYNVIAKKTGGIEFSTDPVAPGQK